MAIQTESLTRIYSQRVIAVNDMTLQVVILPAVWIVAAAQRLSVPDDGVTWYGVTASLMVAALALHMFFLEEFSPISL